MKLNIDFSLIIIVLVLAQLFILNIKIKPAEEDKNEKKMETVKLDRVQDEKKVNNDELVLVVHSVNGEEKTYSRKTVA